MVLHITNDFSGSTVYKNLIGELDSIGLTQIVYNPIRESSRIGKTLIDLNTPSSVIEYSLILNKTLDRVLYRKKIKKITQDIESKINLSEVKIIHAHTWFSDGGVAYLLALKYNIPFIVSIRSTDINVFYKYLIHQRSFGVRILKQAKQIVLISASYRARLLELPSIKKMQLDVVNKLSVIPNGVAPFWISNSVERLRLTVPATKEFKILYVGKFNRGKNVVNLLRAIDELNANQSKLGFRFKVLIVGGGGNDEKRVLRLISRRSNCHYFGPIEDKNQLKNIYREADLFAMPSRFETFGLVYVEALLQGLPIIYMHNEGIDGYYDNRIGEKAMNASVEEISGAICRIVEHYVNYDYDIKQIANNHNWKVIARIYADIYQKFQLS